MSPSAKRITNIQLVFPQRTRPLSSYKSFLKEILVIPENRKLFAAVQKSTIDAEFEAQTRQHFNHDEKALRRMINEVGSTWRPSERTVNKKPV